MFTSLHFVFVSLFFTLFGILLIGALGALLALYSTSKDEYASSIRWSQQGGYLEMFLILRNSFRHVPRRTTAAMIIAVAASISVPFVSVGLGRMVHQVDIGIDPGSTLSQTSQILLDSLVSTGWTQFLARSTTMEDALKTMLVDPRYIVDMDPGKQYTPKTYGYKVDCNKFNTAIDFANVTSVIFDDTTNLPLLDIMDTLTRNSTFASLTNNATMVILTDTNGAMVHYLSCISRWVTKGSDISLLCQYIVVDAISTTAHLGDPAIEVILRNKTVSLSNKTNKVVMRHFASSSTSTGMAVYSVSSILNATSAATRYLASLGPNLVMDVENQKLTILYDTLEIQSVTEIPTVLFWVMVAVMAVCVLLIAYSMIKIDTIHSGTLYMVLYEKLMQKEEPALMNCNFEPLTFDGMQIIATDANKSKKSEA
ncbi:hypothetical protein BGZ92_008566 [Podila epicladia]|nr:hypothetical protein BGZ92_008566 [Podila epicladia]